jgi:hypothetical protein
VRRLVTHVLPFLLLTGCGDRAPAGRLPGEAPAARDASHPATVTALRFRTWISTGGMRDFRAGHWQEAIWFPEWKLEARTHTEGHPATTRLVVSPAEFPHANTKLGIASYPPGDERAPYQGPTERIEVPRALAESIRSAYEQQTAWEAAQERVGSELAASGLLREVPDNVAQRQVDELASLVVVHLQGQKSLPESLGSLRLTDGREILPMPKGLDLDPWGRAFVYRLVDERTFNVRSLGADGKPDTDDDIVAGFKT